MQRSVTLHFQILAVNSKRFRVARQLAAGNHFFVDFLWSSSERNEMEVKLTLVIILQGV